MNAPCSGPCQPSILDFAAYIGLILLALLAVGGIWLTLQGLARSGRLNARAIPMLVSVPALVLGAVVVGRFPQPRWEPSTINAGLSGSGRSDTFYLQGSYSVGWTVQSPQGAPCHLSATLIAAQSGILVQTLTSAQQLSGLSGGRYYVEGDSNCEWRVTLTPIADTAESAG